MVRELVIDSMYFTTLGISIFNLNCIELALKRVDNLSVILHRLVHHFCGSGLDWRSPLLAESSITIHYICFCCRVLFHLCGLLFRYYKAVKCRILRITIGMAFVLGCRHSWFGLTGTVALLGCIFRVALRVRLGLDIGCDFRIATFLRPLVD